MRTFTTAALFVTALMLSGCGAIFGGGGDSQPIQSYVFSPREFEQLPPTDSQIVILVAPLSSVGHDTRDMTYTMRPYEHTYYAYSQWADTPPRMMEPLVVQALESSGLFAAVVDVSSSVSARLRVDIDLLVLQHEFHVEPSQGRIVVRVQLHDLDTSQVLGTRVLQAERPAPTENAYGGALALNLALEDILGELIDWINDEIDDL